MIDIKKTRREIARHLRNGKFELTEGGVLVRGGMNALVNGAVRDTLYRDGTADAQLSPNLVVNEALVNILNVYFEGATQSTAWYVGLFSGNVTPQSTWTGATVVAQSTEFTAYSETTRPLFDTETATTPQISNSGSDALFSITGSGNTVRGAFIATASAKGATSGLLFAAARFAADRTGLGNPDKLGVEYVVTAADAG